LAAISLYFNKTNKTSTVLVTVINIQKLLSQFVLAL